MKINYYFLLLFLFSISCSAQQEEVILKYEKYLEKFPPINLLSEHINNMEIKELQKAAKFMYEAYEENAVKTIELLAKKDKEIDSLNKINKGINSEYIEKLMPDEAKWKLLDKFREEFPQEIYALIQSPYLLKVSIKTINKFIYEDPSSPARLPRTNIKATVLEVIKGKSRFKPGEEFTFYFMDHWLSTSKSIIEDNTYFISLYPQWSMNYELTSLALDTTFDESNYGLYPVKEGFLIDEMNFWGNGNKVYWADFKSSLLQNINLIKSW